MLHGAYVRAAAAWFSAPRPSCAIMCRFNGHAAHMIRDQPLQACACAGLAWVHVWRWAFLEGATAVRAPATKSAPWIMTFWSAILQLVLLFLTLSKPGFFWAPKTKGGGHIVPPSKNPVTLLRIHSSKRFLKACSKMNLLTQLWFPWKPWLGF